MKTLPQSCSPRHPLFTIALAALTLLPETGSAASISITSGPTPGTSGNVIQNSNTFGFSQVSETLVKVTGVGEYTATGATSAITLAVGGLVSAQAGDSLSLDYDFSFSFTGTGSVSWTLTSLLFNFFPGPSSSGGPITIADSGNFSGTKSYVSPISANNAAWSALLTANWTGATTGDTLSVIIPNNSIDLAVIPEPSSLLLLGLGGGLLVRRRR